MLKWLQLGRVPQLDSTLEVHPPGQEIDRISLPVAVPRTASLLALLYGAGVRELVLRCGRTKRGRVFFAYGVDGTSCELLRSAFEHRFPGATLREVRPADALWSFDPVQVDSIVHDWTCAAEHPGLVDITALPRDATV